MAEYDFFISYARADRKTAKRLCELLQDRTAKCFLDTQDLRPGAYFSRELREALHSSRATIAIVSEHTNDADYQQAEILEAFNLRTQTKGKEHDVIPVLVLKDGRTPHFPLVANLFTSLEVQAGNEEDLHRVAMALAPDPAPVPETRKVPGAFLIACDLDDFSKRTTDQQVQTYSLSARRCPILELTPQLRHWR
jgi:hypothetical protein